MAMGTNAYVTTSRGKFKLKMICTSLHMYPHTLVIYAEEGFFFFLRLAAYVFTVVISGESDG